LNAYILYNTGLGVRDGLRGGSRIVRRHRGERRGPRRALHRSEPGQYGLGLRDGVAPGAAPARRRRARSGAARGRVQAPRVSEHGTSRSVPYCVPPHAAAATQAWAFATCSRDDSVDSRLQRQLFDNIARAAYKRLDRFSDQGLSNIAWAFAAAGEAQRHEKLFGAVASEAAPRVAEFQPQGFSNLAWCVTRCLSFAWNDERGDSRSPAGPFRLPN
jgi:hypothetical protein